MFPDSSFAHPVRLHGILLTEAVAQCNSLMAQRDNDLNKRMTEASLAIGRFSQMDSTNMRTIAAVTLAFLPGTFMAVCLLINSMSNIQC